MHLQTGLWLCSPETLLVLFPNTITIFIHFLLSQMVIAAVPNAHLHQFTNLFPDGSHTLYSINAVWHSFDGLPPVLSRNSHHNTDLPYRYYTTRKMDTSCNLPACCAAKSYTLFCGGWQSCTQATSLEYYGTHPVAAFQPLRRKLRTPTWPLSYLKGMMKHLLKAHCGIHSILCWVPGCFLKKRRNLTNIQNLSTWK